MNEARSHAVYVKDLWSADWELVDQLYADRVSLACSPEVSEALLYWNYGRVVPFGESAFSVVAPKDYTDYYVRIVIQQSGVPVEWYGIIKEEVDAKRGANDEQRPSGQQYYKAYGMEWFLDREQLKTSYVVGLDQTDVEINRCIGFNLGGGDEQSGRLVGNMSLGYGEKPANIFCEKLADSQRWSAFDVVNYLLTYQSPKDQDGEARITFRLSPAYEEQLLSLEWWKFQLPYEGRTVKEVLDAVMHRNRCMSYRTTVVDNEVVIMPFTYTEEDIELPSANGYNVRKNQDLTDLDYDNEARVKQLVISKDAQATFDEVLVRGNRVVVVFTMENPTTLEGDWDSDLQTEYNSGSTAAASATNNFAKSMYHRNFRNTDRLFRVYRCYRIPEDWNGKTLSNEPVVIDPETVSTTEIVAPAKFWLPGLRIDPQLPLRMDVDYETVTTIENIDALTADDRPPEFRRPFAVYQKTEAHRAYLMHKPEAAQNYGEIPETGVREWACYVTPQAENCGVILDVSGAPQHVIAEDEFTPVADGADDTDWEKELNWKDIKVTVAMHLDSFTQGKWPDEPDIQTTDAIRRMVIDVPGKRAIWIVPDTIIDVKQDGTLKKSDGGWIEDDRKELEDLARLTYEWYSRERRGVDLQLKTLDAQVHVGSLIRTIGVGSTQTTVNSVVTRIIFDLREGSHAIYTQYADLDFRGL